MAWSVQNIPDLSGKVAVITGANSELGFESAKALSGAGAHVVMTARNRERVEAAKAEILNQHTGASLETVELDLGSLISIRDAAEAIRSKYDVIDILLNNAGIMATPEGQTTDGFGPSSESTISAIGSSLRNFCHRCFRRIALEL